MSVSPRTDHLGRAAVSLCYPAPPSSTSPDDDAGSPGASLTGPPRPRGRRLSQQAADDIGLTPLREQFGLPEELLFELCVDLDTISYRQSVLGDVLASPELREILREVRPMLRELAYFTATRKEQSSPLQQAVWRLGELETYVACLDRLADATAISGAGSEGMRTLARFVAERRADPVYQRLQEELPALRGGLKRRASVTIGINLDGHGKLPRGETDRNVALDGGGQDNVTVVLVKYLGK